MPCVWLWTPLWGRCMMYSSAQPHLLPPLHLSVIIFWFQRWINNEPAKIGSECSTSLLGKPRQPMSGNILGKPWRIIMRFRQMACSRNFCYSMAVEIKLEGRNCPSTMVCASNICSLQCGDASMPWTAPILVCDVVHLQISGIFWQKSFLSEFAFSVIPADITSHPNLKTCSLLLSSSPF